MTDEEEDSVAGVDAGPSMPRARVMALALGEGLDEEEDSGAHRLPALRAIEGGAQNSRAPRVQNLELLQRVVLEALQGAKRIQPGVLHEGAKQKGVVAIIIVHANGVRQVLT